jgi:hypothetical protein
MTLLETLITCANVEQETLKYIIHANRDALEQLRIDTLNELNFKRDHGIDNNQEANVLVLISELEKYYQTHASAMKNND